MFEDIHFPGQGQNERVIIVIRRHWFLITGKIIKCILFLLGLFAIYAILYFVFPQFFSDNMKPAIFILTVIYVLSVFLYFFMSWIDYYLDVGIITDDRIIDVDQKGFFNRVASEQKIYRVQDVTAEVKGMFQTFYNFGNLYIQTAAEKERFIFENVPDPYGIKRRIIDAHDAALQREDVQKLISEERNIEYPEQFGQKEKDEVKDMLKNQTSNKKF